MDRKLVILVCLVLISSLTVTSALAQHPEPPDTNGADLPDHVPGEVLIRFNPWINSTQATLQMEQLDLKLKREIPVLDVKLVKLPPGLSVEEAISRFSRRPGVEFVEPNYILQIAAINQEEITDQWGLQKIEATQAWSTFNGQPKVPITLATVDSGVDPTHNDLSANMWSNSDEIPDNSLDDDNNGYIDDTWGWDFVNNDNDPFDDNMHGTAVSSVMAGDLDGDGVAGVCPWCKVMAVKVMTAGGTGTLDVVANGIIYAANSGARVINLSLAGIAGMQTLQDAVDLAWTQGALVVAGAGNDGANAPMYPAGYANAMAIGSTGETDTHSCFSNYAEGYISVVAPGENILVAILDQEYGIGSGTSLSTPFVAGLGGLLFSQNPERTNSEVRSIIEGTSEDLSPEGVDAAFGHGRINAYRAVTGDYTETNPPDGLFSTNNSATGYAHARKLMRDSNGVLHMIWHTKEGTSYRIRYATSGDGGNSWNLEPDVFSSQLETYHPAIASDGQNLFVAIPSRSGVDQPYQILFTRKALPSGDWTQPVSLMGGTYDAIRPDLYFDPSSGKLHMIASSFDNAPYVYYQSSDDGGLSWNNSVAEINPSTGTEGANSRTRYATIHASGNNIYIVSRTVNSVLFFTYYYMHSVRSSDGGQTWFDQFKISSYSALLSGEYGVSLAGVGDRVYMGYEVGSNMYFRIHDGTSWSPYETLELGDSENAYKWPTITQSEDGQAWLIFESNGELFIRHYDGSTWAAKESIGTGSYANLKLGTNGDRVEWITTQCNGAPFLVSYDSRTLGANNPPHADDQAVSTNEDTTFAITLTGSDPDDDPLSFTVVSGPSNGSLTGTAPNLTYTPDPNYNGMDSFTFVVNDGATNSNAATVTITVTAVNDPPAADDQGVITDEDTAVSITLTASDVDDDPLIFNVVLGPANGTLSGTAPNLTYTPNPGYSGEDTFTFKVNDGIVDSDPATVTITVTEVNQPPVADAQSVGTDEDNPVGITLTASDPDGDALTYGVVTGPTKGSLNGTAPNLTYTPDPDFNGVDSFTFLANDGVEESNIATVDITITAVNDSPIADPQAVITDEDTAVGITITANDVDGDPLTYSVVVGPTNGTLSGTAPGLTYTPSQDFNGSDNYTFKVNDGNVASNIAIVDITVTAVNDSPVADDQVVSTDEDNPVAITITGSDVDGDELTYSVLTLPANGILSGTIPDLTYTPNANFNGPDNFNFNVDDGNGKNDIATMSITISAVNDAPVANPQAVTTDEDNAVAVILTGSDVDSGSLTFSVLTSPTYGSLSGTAPDLTYTPNENYNGPDSFIFKANDESLDSNTATVSITVTAVNDPPVANPQGVTTDEDTPVAITLTASDVDSGSLTFSVVSGPANGTLSGTAPSFNYMPNANFNGSDSLTFKATDDTDSSNIATVSITVTAVNDPPVANPQGVTTDEDTPVAITLTASDVDSGSLTFSVLTSPTYGSLSGTAPDLTYTPTENYNGTDSFTFKANDESLDSNIATVDITVTAAPLVVDAVASGEILVAGTVSGDYTNTYEDGGAIEAITERDSGGKPIRRFSYLEHIWTFEVTPGNAVTLYANAWSSDSIDGDNFDFAYSTDDANYTDMFVVANTSDVGYVAYGLPDSIQGTVYVRVSDSDHTAGNRDQDTVFVDHLYIRSETQPGDPPNAPTDLSAIAVSAGQIDLAWSDTSTDEYGFQIERSLDYSSWSEIATVGENVSSYSDMDLSPNTTYYYQVRAYNGSGSSNYSNVASAKTKDGLSLTGTGYKVKGVHVVDLEWIGSAAPPFFIYRDRVEIAQVTGNDYSDNTGNKGGASYQYQVCEVNNPMNCSNTVWIDY